MQQPLASQSKDTYLQHQFLNFWQKETYPKISQVSVVSINMTQRPRSWPNFSAITNTQLETLVFCLEPLGFWNAQLETRVSRCVFRNTITCMYMCLCLCLCLCLCNCLLSTCTRHRLCRFWYCILHYISYYIYVAYFILHAHFTLYFTFRLSYYMCISYFILHLYFMLHGHFIFDLKCTTASSAVSRSQRHDS